ncbi:MAG: hypothetical protein JWM68_642 [Verrucomicrobiales bacterium]|nr:hypothetical protein [Verrucomicrobiales bacterium]
MPPNAFTVDELILIELASSPNSSIPPHYWGAPIRALKPLRVHYDRSNIAVVTKQNEREERGVYYYVSISSYLPVDAPGRQFHWNKKADHLEYVFTN